MDNNKLKFDEVIAAYNAARACDPACTSFTIRHVEYRRVTIPDAPLLAWSVSVSNIDGDVFVDKRDGNDPVRPVQTEIEGYLIVSILRAAPTGPDNYFRRRVHFLVAHAFIGPPSPGSLLVEHLDDDGRRNDADNLIWSDQARNRARKATNDLTGFTPSSARSPPPWLNATWRCSPRCTRKGGDDAPLSGAEGTLPT
jgi:hypothetical protein